MTRKQFQAHLKEAVVHSKHHLIHQIKPGDDDGQFTFIFTGFETPITITASVPDISEYPLDHDYMIFAAEDTPASIAALLQAKLSSVHAKTIHQLLELVPQRLLLSSSDQDSDLEDEDPDDDTDIYLDGSDAGDAPAFQPRSLTQKSSTPFQQRVRRDLQRAKDANFRVSHFGGLDEGMKCVVSVSVSARKLGLSQEAMQAWNVDPSDYVILLIQFPDGYMTFEELRNSKESLHIRVGARKSRYKPTHQQVTEAFAIASGSEPISTHDQQDTPFRSTFISKPLSNLMSERLVPLLGLRPTMTWSEAEDFYRNHQGVYAPHATLHHASGKIHSKEKSSGYPRIVDADHLATDLEEHSFPLIAMQFMLRHFVRCTEFCLVCHQKLDTSLFEALKPYVCDAPLCLYQYMTLGFGPSIEHEIMTQEKVVDLLLSFCYSSAINGRLRDFPKGLALSVPSSITTPPARYALPQASGVPAIESSDFTTEARFNEVNREVLFDANTTCLFRRGDWVVISLEGETASYHCKVDDASLYPSVKLGPLINEPSAVSSHGLPPEHGPKPKSQWQSAYVEKYDVNFDELTDDSKRWTIVRLLALLPAVSDMKQYLAKQNTPDLTRWVDRISPACLSMLRWVIASNRSCILEVDPENAVYGMKGWLQFRFAMGAPDKEHRFAAAVHEKAAQRYPTIYAWHGSRIQNWHSIIREGLHFKDALNGRAYGDGVYHAPDCSTSLGYSRYHPNSTTTSANKWSNSSLQIDSAIALNEIVNAPNEFVSSHPHYVVSQLDWIQTRYLFIKCSGTAVSDPNLDTPVFDRKPAIPQPQDPKWTPRGADGNNIVIPATSRSTQKRKLKETPRSRKSKKTKGKSVAKAIDLTVDDADEVTFEDNKSGDDTSDVTDEEDHEFFNKRFQQVLALGNGPPQTDFVPGSLDHERLPKLPRPGYANHATTKRLQQDFQALLKLQDTKPLHELGWYVDPAKFDNVYQWIVELHSFENLSEGKLPLAVDMKKHDIQSIVLELRFPGSYPMNPPFVRVIRPRFLPFLQGGGGHITAGGAVCHELLTSNGWMATISIESVLFQIRLAMASTDPKPARLESSHKKLSYGSGEAIEAYKRACRQHGWRIPDDFDQTASTG